MCITFIYVNNDTTTEDEFKVVIAFNRDEYYERPTQPAHFWNDACISGVDKQTGREGGTWFGMNSKSGRIGALLNIKQPVLLPDKRPRGHLVIGYLLTANDPETYLNGLVEDRHLYNPFNLILLEHSSEKWSIHYLCSDDLTTPTKLSPGILGFSNTPFEHQSQKVIKGKTLFKEIVDTYNTVSMEETLKQQLFDMMADRTRHLIDSASKCLEVGLHCDATSSIFVDLSSRAYGTRTTTLLLIDARGRCSYIEKTMKQSAGVDGRLTCETDLWETSSYAFSLPNKHI